MGLDFDDLGDKHKNLESIQAGVKLIPGIPVIARLDGRAFHTLTRFADKPYDTRIINSMRETAQHLLSEFHADIAYVQSDEITLVWKDLDLFNLKVQKLCSVLASAATGKFIWKLSENMYRLPENLIPTFDCRVWQVKDLEVAAENILWREWDAAKNSVSMAAHALFSTKELHGKGMAAQIQMMEEKGYHWNLLPATLKRGSYFRKEVVERSLTGEELKKIPEQHRPAEGDTFFRKTIIEKDFPRLTSIENLVGTLFGTEVPVIKGRKDD